MPVVFSCLCFYLFPLSFAVFRFSWLIFVSAVYTVLQGGLSFAPSLFPPAPTFSPTQVPVYLQGPSPFFFCIWVTRCSKLLSPPSPWQDSGFFFASACFLVPLAPTSCRSCSDFFTVPSNPFPFSRRICNTRFKGPPHAEFILRSRSCLIVPFSLTRIFPLSYSTDPPLLLFTPGPMFSVSLSAAGFSHVRLLFSTRRFEQYGPPVPVSLAASYFFPPLILKLDISLPIAPGLV